MTALPRARDEAVSRRGLLAVAGWGSAAAAGALAGSANAAAGLRLSTSSADVEPGGGTLGWYVDVHDRSDLAVAGQVVEFAVRDGRSALRDAAGAAVSTVLARASTGGRVRAPQVVAAGVGSTVVDVRVPGGRPSTFTLRATARPGSTLGWGSGFGVTPQVVAADVPARGERTGEVAALEAVAAVVLGRQEIDLDADGTLWQAGSGTGRVLLPWSAVMGVRSLVAGLSSAHALTGDGEVWGWGDNSRGQLGPGPRRIPAEHPQRLDGLPASAVGSLAVGGATGYALLADGSVWSWGAGDRGQLGTGRLVDSAAPAPVTGLPPAHRLAAAGRTAFAVDRSGALWGWGRNDLGQVGDRTLVDRLVPVAIDGAGPVREVETDGRTTRALV